MAVTTLGWYQAMHVGIHPLEWGFSAFGRARVGRTRELAIDTVFAKVSIRLGARSSGDPKKNRPISGV